jgi:hypothetical protein
MFPNYVILELQDSPYHWLDMTSGKVGLSYLKYKLGPRLSLVKYDK